MQIWSIYCKFLLVEYFDVNIHNILIAKLLMIVFLQWIVLILSVRKGILSPHTELINEQFLHILYLIYLWFCFNCQITITTSQWAKTNQKAALVSLNGVLMYNRIIFLKVIQSVFDSMSGVIMIVKRLHSTYWELGVWFQRYTAMCWFLKFNFYVLNAYFCKILLLYYFISVCFENVLYGSYK